MTRFSLSGLCALGGLTMALAGCGDSADETVGDNGTEMPQPEASGDIVETAMAAEGFDSLVAAVEQAGLVDTLKGEGPFTVFAPTDAAFAELLGALDVQLEDLSKEELTSILTYHVLAQEAPASAVTQLAVASTVNGADIRIRVDGERVFLVGGAGEVEVVATDITATNGVIHVIDQVLLPPENIATVATNAGFDSLVAAVVKADLVDTLSNAGPFTVFAPTDEAFSEALAALGVTLDELTAEDLAPILTYHVVPGKLYSEDVVAASGAMTVQGSEVRISVSGGSVVLNEDVNVVATDVLADNGVIHIIDGVLLPPAE